MVVPPTLFYREAMTDDPKPALRRLFRAQRHRFVAGLTLAEREALYRELAKVAAPAVAGFSLPGSYAAVGDEIDPTQIEHGFAAIAFPRINGSEISFRSASWDQLVPGPLGIPQPSADAPQVTPDLLLVPLLAVTPAGVRLGQGKGYYDRAIAQLRRLAPVRTVALAWDVQIADALPADAWDMPVDFIATPTRLFDCARNR
jgi:5-formyltetrahydrofolate cyclo-ligase